MWDCDSTFKSSGLDGVNFTFIIDFCEMQRLDFVTFLEDFHANGRLVRGVNVLS